MNGSVEQISLQESPCQTRNNVVFSAAFGDAVLCQMQDCSVSMIWLSFENEKISKRQTRWRPITDKPLTLILDAAKAQDLVVTWDTSRSIKIWDATQGQQTAEHLNALPADSLLRSDSNKIFTDGKQIFLLGLKMMPIEDEDESESESERSSLASTEKSSYSEQELIPAGWSCLIDVQGSKIIRSTRTYLRFFDALRSTCIDWSAQCVYVNRAELFWVFADGSLSVAESFYGILSPFTPGCNSFRYVAMVQGNDRINVYGLGGWKRPTEVVGINLGESLSRESSRVSTLVISHTLLAVGLISGIVHFFDLFKAQRLKTLVPDCHETEHREKEFEVKQIVIHPNLPRGIVVYARSTATLMAMQRAKKRHGAWSIALWI